MPDNRVLMELTVTAEAEVIPAPKPSTTENAASGEDQE